MKRSFYLLSIVLIIIMMLIQSCGVNTPREIYIQDDANILKQSEIEDIQSILKNHNENFIGRISIRIIPSLPQGKSIDLYANELIKRYSKTANEKNDRILMLIAVKDRKLRIETSLEVWNVVSDEYCKNTITEIIAPKFRASEYYSGIKSGAESLINKLQRP